MGDWPYGQLLFSNRKETIGNWHQEVWFWKKLEVIEKLISEQVDLSEMESGFMSKSGATNHILIFRQLPGKYLSKKKKDLDFAFVESDNFFPWIPRDVFRWALRWLGLQKWWVKLAQLTHENTGRQARVNGSFKMVFWSW